MATRQERMAKADPDRTTAKPGRRRFLNWLWAAVGLGAATEYCGLIGSFLLSRNASRGLAKAETVVVAGQAETFKPGTVTAIPQGRFYLSRLPDGGFLALSRACTHLGCSITWDEEQNRFACPCHGSTFSASGEVLTGPAARPLDFYPTRLENGAVKVDVAVSRRRERFEPDQATKL